MYVLNLTDEYDNITFTNCTDIENSIDNLYQHYFHDTMWSIIFVFNRFDDIHKPQTFKNQKRIMEKFLYPNHPVRCIITGPSESGKAFF